MSSEPDNISEVEDEEEPSEYEVNGEQKTLESLKVKKEVVVNKISKIQEDRDHVETISELIKATEIIEKEKKITHKEKKKLKKQQDYEKQMETMLKKGGQGHSELDSNFTVSQAQKTAGQLAAMENAVDIKIENFSIAAKGKDLFVNANLLIANGRHYGLVGPNG